jgi:hypothetical protein
MILRLPPSVLAIGIYLILAQYASGVLSTVCSSDVIMIFFVPLFSQVSRGMPLNRSAVSGLFLYLMIALNPFGSSRFLIVVSLTT